MNTNNKAFAVDADERAVWEQEEQEYWENEERADDEHDGFLSDAEADGDALASAGWGTDEDYGGEQW